jgi:hypothetical protein
MPSGKDYIGSTYWGDVQAVPVENARLVHHMDHGMVSGVNSKFSKFDLTKTVDNTIWFTSSVDSIRRGESGASGNKYILKCEITISNPAGWDIYDKYSLEEIQNMGYDGIILPDDGNTNYVVFSESQVKIL